MAGAQGPGLAASEGNRSVEKGSLGALRPHDQQYNTPEIAELSRDNYRFWGTTR
jgi:hypothetical protein